jgi:hypothetical protein
MSVMNYFRPGSSEQRGSMRFQRGIFSFTFGITPPDPMRLIDFALPLHVQRRLSWCLRTNVHRIRHACHPAAISFARDFVTVNDTLSRCSTCQRRRCDDSEDSAVSRSWFESWKLACGICKRPFHLEQRNHRNFGAIQTIVDLMWQDAKAGSAMFSRYLAGKSCGLLPPRLVWRLLSTSIRRTQGHSTGFGLIVPESLHPSFGTIHQFPATTIRTENSLKRLALLAALKRFNDRPVIWIDRLADFATQSGRAGILAIVESLPEKICSYVTHPPSASAPTSCLLYASHEVDIHAFRIKLAVNLRKTDGFVSN